MRRIVGKGLEESRSRVRYELQRVDLIVVHRGNVRTVTIGRYERHLDYTRIYTLVLGVITRA